MRHSVNDVYLASYVLGYKFARMVPRETLKDFKKALNQQAAVGQIEPRQLGKTHWLRPLDPMRNDIQALTVHDMARKLADL